MWVGTQTSQVEIKLSLKACQVRPCVLNSGTFTPLGSLSCSSRALIASHAPGLHPTHALQGPHAAPQAAVGAERQRALALHPLLPRLERLPQAPSIRAWGSGTAHTEPPQHSAPLMPALNRWIRFSLNWGQREALGCPCPPFFRLLPLFRGTWGSAGPCLRPAQGNCCSKAATSSLQLGSRGRMLC